jgi:glyceraldehyde 3-phosphate dehydrogenase
MTVKVAVNGFGRTGRLALRAAFENDLDLDFVAVNRGDPKTLGHLLKYDSVHGKAPFSVDWDDENIVVDGKKIRVLYESDAEQLPWKELGVDLVLECSDIYKDREGASKHLKAGASKVLISAPAKKPDCTIVLGVNDKVYDKSKHSIVSNASCTTNCLAPVAKVMNDSYGIVNGFMTTIHAYTNTQVVLDKSSKDLRRARAANLSIIPTTSGVTKAISEVIPSLEGKLDGMALRVPTPNVSIINFVANLEKRASVEELNDSFREASKSRMKGIMNVSDEPLVSVDYIHNPYSAVIDSLETRALGKTANILAWYDNEWGYCCRLVELAEKML